MAERLSLASSWPGVPREQHLRALGLWWKRVLGREAHRPPWVPTVPQLEALVSLATLGTNGQCLACYQEEGWPSGSPELSRA